MNKKIKYSDLMKSSNEKKEKLNKKNLSLKEKIELKKEEERVFNEIKEKMLKKFKKDTGIK